LGKESRCPYCLDDLVGKDQRVVRCVLCRTPHHEACFNEHGGCTAFGCAGRASGEAGNSIMIRRPVLVIGAPWREVPLIGMPERLVQYRAAKRVDSDDSETFRTGIRISIARPHLNPNDDLKIRVVVALTAPCRVRWLELRILDEPKRLGPPPTRLLSARLLGRPPLTLKTLARSVASLATPAPWLGAGRHPFEVEVPRLFGTTILQGYDRSVSVSAVLEPTRGPTLASARVPLLLVYPSAPPPAAHREEDADALLFTPGRFDAFREGADAGPHQDVAHPRAAPPIIRRHSSRRARIPADEGAGHTIQHASEDDLGILPATPTGPHMGGAWPRATPVPPKRPENPVSGDSLIGIPLEEVPARPAAPARPSAPAEPRAAAEPRDFPSLSELVALPPLARPAEPPPRAGEPAPDVGFALSVRKRETRVFAASPVEDAPKGPPPVFSAGAGSQAPPPAGPGGSPEEAGWSRLTFRAGSLQGETTGHVLRARFATRTDLPPLRLSLETPARGEDPLARAVDLSIDAPGAFDTLDLGCRYELHDSKGRDLSLGRFPRTEEVALLGGSALPPSRTGGEERILLSMPIDPGVLEEARRLVGPDGFPPKDLVLRFAVDGVSRDGTRTASGTRLVLVSLAAAAAPSSDL
jgi:hypothetical protein